MNKDQTALDVSRDIELKKVMPQQAAQSLSDEAPDQAECDHEWEFQDDSFDHEFGVERIHYMMCESCGETRAMEAGDYCDDYDY